MADERKLGIRPGRILLALALLAALCLVGYQRGYRRGYVVAATPAANAGQVYIVTYSVGDLVLPLEATAVSNADRGRPSATTGIPVPGGSSGPPAADFDSLIDLIVTTIEHDSWMENGTGDGEIHPFPTNLSLVISQTQRVHAQVADLLEQLRKMNGSVGAQEIVPFIQSCAAQTRDAHYVYRQVAANAAGRAAARPIYDKSVRNIADLWGEPEFLGAPDSPDFPEWSDHERVAVWSRAGGIAYLALSDDGLGQPQVLAGWRRDR